VLADEHEKLLSPNLMTMIIIITVWFVLCAAVHEPGDPLEVDCSASMEFIITSLFFCLPQSSRCTNFLSLEMTSHCFWLLNLLYILMND
jgi:hypothetical protein